MTYDPRRWAGYNTLYEENLNKNSESKQPSTYEYNPQPTTLYGGIENNSSSDIYNNGAVRKRVDEYDPSAPSIVGLSKQEEENQAFSREKPDPRKLDFYITSLQKMITPLPYDYKKMLPYDVICQIAHAILDGTVFDIAKGLRDIQKITEKNLSAKRLKLVNEQRGKRQEIMKRQKNEIENSQSRPHQILIYEKNHAEELKMLNEKIEKELMTLDQKLVLDLDQQVSDQQSTLERAGLPLFFITNNPDEIKVQMYILEFITKLSGG